MTSTQMPKLTGDQLLQKVRELADADKQQLVISCGYYYQDDEGFVRENYLEFYEALLDAKGITLAAFEPTEEVTKEVTTEDQTYLQEQERILEMLKKAEATGDNDLHYEALQQYRRISKPVDTFEIDSREYAVKSAKLILPQFYQRLIGNEEKAREAAEFMAINQDLYVDLYNRVTATSFGVMSVWIAHETLNRFHAHWAGRRGGNEEALVEGGHELMFDVVEKDFFETNQSTDEWVKEKGEMSVAYYGDSLIGNFVSVLITDCYGKFDNHNNVVPSFYYDQVKRLGEAIHIHRTSNDGANAFMIDSIMNAICSVVMYNELLFENTNGLSDDEKADFICNRFDEIEQYYLESI